jgi:hypothetical protein
MMGDLQNVPIVPIFVPTLFQNGCCVYSNRAQLRFPARRFRITTHLYKEALWLAPL